LELDPKLVESLRRAIDRMPDDTVLRLHLATLLIEAGRRDEGIREVGAVLMADPANAAALALLAGGPGGSGPAGPGSAGQPVQGVASPGHSGQPDEPAKGARLGSDAGPVHEEAGPGAGRASAAEPGGPVRGDAGAGLTSESGSGAGGRDEQAASAGSQHDPRPEPAAMDFDWGAAESQLADVLPPRFVGADGTPERVSLSGDGAGEPGSGVFEVEQSRLRLADVAGLAEVKQRLEAAFLAPLRNPELRKLYGKSLRGGLLMYGPPGCGKTFIARAVAGELGARFLEVSFADVVDSMLGQSERNIREIFETARENAPCVVFLDEVDAIGQKRTQLRHTPMRAVVNQLLVELDDVTADNEGVFLLAATNHPWDVDSALRRPGRFDRMLLVLPPDQAARAAIFRYHLRDRPVERVDPERLAKLTEGYSGADIAHICESAAELALLDSVSRGEPRMIGQPDLEAATRDVRPSLSPWFDAARNVALFANEGGAYDDLAAYLKKNRLM
jgi:AAA+ superfamily predicted ATPase